MVAFDVALAPERARSVGEVVVDLLDAALAQVDQGLLRLEGKDYVVQDGDVIHFRFNV